MGRYASTTVWRTRSEPVRSGPDQAPAAPRRPRPALNSLGRGSILDVREACGEAHSTQPGMRSTSVSTSAATAHGKACNHHRGSSDSSWRTPVSFAWYTPWYTPWYTALILLSPASSSTSPARLPAPGSWDSQVDPGKRQASARQACCWWRHRASRQPSLASAFLPLHLLCRCPSRIPVKPWLGAGASGEGPLLP